jgi:hypothetical protein
VGIGWAMVFLWILSDKGVNSSATIKISQFCLFLKSTFVTVQIKFVPQKTRRSDNDITYQSDGAPGKSKSISFTSIIRTNIGDMYG